MDWIDENFIKLMAPDLLLFKQVDSRVFNFRCPICGDSKKDRTKTRGYFYPSKNNFRFKCHNCNANLSLYEFIDKKFPQYLKDYRFEKFKANKKVRKPPVNTTELTVNNTKVRTLTPDQVFDRFRKSVVPISSLNVDHPAVQYLASRMIPERAMKSLYWCEKLSDFDLTKTEKIHRGAVCIPYFTDKKTFCGIDARSIDPTSRHRYVSLKFDEEYTGDMIFGSEKFDKTKLSFLVEGPFDSMFYPNAIAAGGSSFKRACRLAVPENSVVVIDNQPRNKDVVRELENFLIPNGWNVFIWPPGYTMKDTNDLILSGRVSPENLVEFVLNHTYSGLSLKAETLKWRNNG